MVRVKVAWNVGIRIPATFDFMASTSQNEDCLSGRLCLKMDRFMMWAFDGVLGKGKADIMKRTDRAGFILSSPVLHAIKTSLDNQSFYLQVRLCPRSTLQQVKKQCGRRCGGGFQPPCHLYINMACVVPRVEFGVVRD
jgi:hypothetical protein